jgi:hypothetical protein
MSKIIIFISIIILLLFINNLKNYIDLKENFEDKNEKKKYILPKVIYGFWDDLDTNPIIQSHIRNWRKKFSPDWEIIILNKDNVYKHVDLAFLNKFGTGKIDATRFADFLRIDLLKKKGGCWIDASIFILNGKFLDDYYDEMIKNKYDACFYEYKENTILPSQPHIDNWFMMAPKGSKIISDLYYEFERAFDMDFLKYKNNVLIPSNILLDKTIGYGESTYLMQHAIFHYLFKIGKKYNILLKNASESMYKLHILYNWDHIKIIKFIVKNNNWDRLYAIKLTKGNRAAIKDKDQFIKKIDSL